VVQPGSLLSSTCVAGDEATAEAAGAAAAGSTTLIQEGIAAAAQQAPVPVTLITGKTALRGLLLLLLLVHQKAFLLVTKALQGDHFL
jgi:hypothetical protein